MIHPPPQQIAVTYCSTCARVGSGAHVNREDEIPKRFCSHCGMSLGVFLYRFERPAGPQGK